MSDELTAEDLGVVHFIGVGGVGMCGLARMFASRGIQVTGSELREWPQLAALRALGVTIHSSHQATNLDGVDTVVYSTAIGKDHLEIVEARHRGLRVLHRSEALAAAMAGRRAIAVAGTHGKTTTTSMTTVVLQHAGLDPSFVIGGEISEVGSNGHHGSGAHFVVEADESDRSFLRYRPFVSIITNIDTDHLNTYGDLAGLSAAFEEFCRQTDPAGFVVACVDNDGARTLAATLRNSGLTVYTYGESDDADLRVSEIVTTASGTRYLAALEGHSLGEVALPVPGRFLALNSAAAMLTAVKLGVDVATVVESLASFPGVRRRFELKGTINGVRVYDEYAYHHVSIAGALETLRAIAGGGQLVVVFQPYRMYRTRDFQREIAEALALGDQVVILEVFGPGETREPGEGGVALTAAVPLPSRHKVFVPSWDDVPGEVARRVREGDVVVTMGAPPISLMGEEILSALAGMPAVDGVAPAPDGALAAGTPAAGTPATGRGRHAAPEPD